MAKQTSGIKLRDTVPGSVTVERLRKNAWRLTQRFYGKEHDNNHNPTWIEIDNPGRAAKVHVRLKWAESGWMQLRKFGYLRQGRKYISITGRITTTETHYEFTAPPGSSYFGSVPWYTNEDADRFMARMCRRSPLCSARTIGLTAEGRELKCLTVARPSRSKRRENVVMLARMHANETAGSWAVEASARYLLGKNAPRSPLNKYAFHFFPIANPDGVANGLKLTRPGPVGKYDMERGSMTSNDPTIAALRNEVLSLRPRCLFDHHCYLMRPPFLYVFDKQLMLKMLDELIDGSTPRKAAFSWCIHIPQFWPECIRDHCYKAFGTAAVVTELPWQGGRLPSDIERLGLQVFQAAMKVIP